MDWMTAEDQIRNGATMCRSSDPKRLVFVNQHGDIVEQRPGGPQFAFTLTQDDDVARDWEFTRAKPGQ